MFSCSWLCGVQGVFFVGFLMKPLILNPAYVRLVDQSPADKNTPVCDCGSFARWVVGPEYNKKPSCGWCFLFASKWGIANRPGIDELIIETEKKMGRSITSPVDGSCMPSEADRML